MARSSISVEGFVSAEPKTRTAGSHTVIDISVPVTPQRFKDGKWEDTGDTVWYKASFWDEHVPAILTTIDKGSLVTITGDGIKTQTYEKDGSTKVSVEISNPQIALVIRRPKKGSPAEEPGAAAAPAGDGWDAPGSYSDETPF